MTTKSTKTKTKTIKPENELDESLLVENVENSDETVGILSYINEPNLRLGTDYRKNITFKLDGRKMKGIIRPLSSDEIAMANTTSNMGQGALDKIIVSLGFYGEDGKTRIPANVLDKFPAGVNGFIASEIMSLSGYMMDEEATQYLKKS